MYTRRFLSSSALAAVTVLFVDFVFNGVVFAAEEAAAIAKVAADPALVDSPVTVALIFGIDLVIGVVLLWTYVAIRPRFGPGPRTALLAAFQVWLVSILPWTILTHLGALTWGFWRLQLGVTLVTYGTGVLVGARAYREPVGER